MTGALMTLSAKGHHLNDTCLGSGCPVAGRGADRALASNARIMNGLVCPLLRHVKIRATDMG
jgi:hypothetical protein